MKLYYVTDKITAIGWQWENAISAKKKDFELHFFANSAKDY